MKNIPVFTTEFGIASLTLEKIPYTGQAYIVIHSATDPEKLLREATDFCCAAGAMAVYASGDPVLEQYPLYTKVIAMSRNRDGLPSTAAKLCPVNKENLSAWREVYNEKMRCVPNAAYLTIRDSEKLLAEGECYYVYRDEKLIGIGTAGEDGIGAIAAVIPGCGKDVLLALCDALPSETVCLEVAENNLPAMRLYKRLDFTENRTISLWYQIK